MKLYHISNTCHGNNFTFRPRVPHNGYLDSDGFYIEDVSTPRVCFSKTIGGAIKAIGDGADGCALGEFHLYVVETDNYFVPNKNKPHPKYGPNFRHHQLRGFPGKHWSSRYRPVKNTDDPYRGCVPDANKTKEVWVLHDITAKYVGMIETYISYNRVRHRKIK